MTQRLPTVSGNLVSAVAEGQPINMEEAVRRLAIENPQLLILGATMANTTNIMAIAIAYELLHKQADLDWTEENCG